MELIRKINKDDLLGIKAVIDSNELFPSELLEDMTADYFVNSQTVDIWLVLEHNNKVIGVAYCAPERMTEGTYNLYLIAILKEYHGKGFGSQLITYIEKELRQNKQRILIVETSGLPEFELTRRFYPKLGYQCVGVIPEFYQAGEDKIVFWKDLQTEK